MAKMFYTLDETKAALGKSEEEIKQYTRENRLREFRDGSRLMFKTDQVENLKAQLSGGALPPSVADLGPSDSGSPIGLADSKGGSGISLVDTGLSGSGLESLPGSAMSGSGLGNMSGAPAGSGMMNLKEDTALAADLGLSGASVGSPSPSARGGGAGTGLSGSAGSRAGINVFGSDDAAEHVDPMAQTSISSSPSSGVDLSLDAVGSGSGLLDLTREADETGLGDILNEAKKGGRPVPVPPSTRGGLESAPGVVSRTPMSGGVTYVTKPDAMAPAFSGLAAGAAVDMVVGLFVLLSAAFGTHPPLLKTLADKQFVMLIVFALIAPVIGFIIGMILGRASGARA